MEFADGGRGESKAGASSFQARKHLHRHVNNALLFCGPLDFVRLARCYETLHGTMVRNPYARDNANLTGMPILSTEIFCCPADGAGGADAKTPAKALNSKQYEHASSPWWVYQPRTHQLKTRFMYR